MFKLLSCELAIMKWSPFLLVMIDCEIICYFEGKKPFRPMKMQPAIFFVWDGRIAISFKHGLNCAKIQTALDLEFLENDNFSMVKVKLRWSQLLRIIFRMQNWQSSDFSGQQNRYRWRNCYVLIIFETEKTCRWPANSSKIWAEFSSYWEFRNISCDHVKICNRCESWALARQVRCGSPAVYTNMTSVVEYQYLVNKIRMVFG